MSKKIKILRILNRLSLGGPTYNVSYLTKFISNKYKTILVCGKEMRFETSSKFVTNQIRVNVKYINNLQREISLFKDFKVLIELIKIIKKFQPDIIHTHASKAGFLGRLAGIICGIKIIIHTFHGHIFHSYFGYCKTKLFILIEKILAKKTNKIIVLSNYQKKELSNHYKIANSNKFKIIKLGFDIKRFTKKNMHSNFFIKKLKLNNYKTVGIIGRLSSIKNINYFIDIAENLINKKKRKIKFIIVGDGERKKDLIKYSKIKRLRTVEFKNKTLKANFDVVFTSWIKKIENLYPALDIVCNTSLNEGTPLSLLESMAAKKPVIGTNVGGVRDIIKNDFNGYCFNIKNKNKMINQIDNLLNNKKERIRLGNNGYNFVKKNHSYLSLVNNTEKIYSHELKKYKKL
jgi:glycosyltransferase involved in cell wall biosynthesis